jgi:hypothetical protein
MSIASVRTRAFLLWITPAIVVALAVARVSVWVQSHFAPVVLFPLLAGAILGALLCGLLEVARFDHLPLAAIGTLLIALLASAAEHGFFYLDYRTALTKKTLEAGLPVEELPQATFGEYMRAQAALDRTRTPMWAAYAALMATAAVGMVVWYLRLHAATDRLDRQSNPLNHSESPHDPLANKSASGHSPHP